MERVISRHSHLNSFVLLTPIFFKYVSFHIPSYFAFYSTPQPVLRWPRPESSGHDVPAFLLSDSLTSKNQPIGTTDGNLIPYLNAITVQWCKIGLICQSKKVPHSPFVTKLSQSNHWPIFIVLPASFLAVFFLLFRSNWVDRGRTSAATYYTLALLNHSTIDIFFCVAFQWLAKRTWRLHLVITQEAFVFFTKKR